MPNYGTDPDPEFEAEATRWREMLLGTLLTAHCAFYNATLAGMPVTILGFATDPQYPTRELKPIAVQVTEPVYERLRVD